MTAKALRDRLERRPFLRFGVRTADGDLLSVPHPEFVSIDPTEEKTLIVWTEDGHYRTIDLELVTQLDPSNGKSRWRRRRN
jgi:hypothetical protein